jgi:hypothetical protein
MGALRRLPVREADRENLARARRTSAGAHAGGEGEHMEVVSIVGNGASGAVRETRRREGTERGSSVSWRWVWQSGYVVDRGEKRSLISSSFYLSPLTLTNFHVLFCSIPLALVECSI